MMNGESCTYEVSTKTLDTAQYRDIRVVYVTDQSNLLLTEFSLVSMMLNSASSLSFAVYGIELARALRPDLHDLAQSLGHSISEETLLRDSGVLAKVSLHPHISPATLFKAQAIGQEAATFARIFYVDGDVLACRRFDLASTFSFPTTAAAVYDFVSYMPFDGQDLIRHRRHTGDSTDYFNAGVLAVHGNRWLDCGLTEVYIEKLLAHSHHCPYRHDAEGKDPGDCKGADQCALNMALENDWTPLDFRWNVQKPLRHHRLWREAFLRHYTGFRKFLARSSVNRDPLERSVLNKIQARTSLRPEANLSQDFGLLFMADRVKYASLTARYDAKVRLLARRASELQRGRPVGDPTVPAHRPERDAHADRRP